MAPLFSFDLAPPGGGRGGGVALRFGPAPAEARGDTPCGCGTAGMPGWIVGDIGCSSASGGAGMEPGRVELSAAIRFDWQRNQMPVRALARKYDVHRRTVRQAIASPVPPGRKTPERQATVLDGVRELIDGMLREDLAAPRKQRHTASRVFERLRDEHGAQVSYSYVAKYVARRRAEITAEDRARAEGLRGFVPQAKDPGAEAEVDFGDVTVCLAGEPARCYMFAYRLSCSGKACHRVYASQAQEAFLEGHVAAFEATGGLPYVHVRYDNLSPAVAKVLTGRNRAETQRWLSFRAHYEPVPAGSGGSPVPGLL